MIDYYLKTATEAEMTELLDGLENVAIDIIGTIYQPTDKVDAEGNSVMAAIDGFHANVRVLGELEEWQVAGLEQHNVTVNSPWRVWA